MLNLKSRDILQQNLSWFIIATLFFCVGIVTAVLFMGNEQFFMGELTESQYEALQEMAEIVFGGSPLQGILYLLINNLLASLMVMFLGVIVGIPTLLGLFSNGALLGSVMAALANEGVSVFPFILRGIVPHGIFELPAFIISAGFGLKVGYHLVFPLPGKKRGESLVTTWREYWSVFPLILKLLVLAAILEVMVTPLLLKQIL